MLTRYAPLEVFGDMAGRSRSDRPAYLAEKRLRIDAWAASEFGRESVAVVLPAVGAVLLHPGAVAMRAAASQQTPRYRLPPRAEWSEMVAGGVLGQPLPRPRLDNGYVPTVGIIDTGLMDHDEFGGARIVRARFTEAGAPVPAVGADPEGHGTFVAALIAGETMGVAPGARLAVAEVFQSGEASHDAVVAALDWLASLQVPTDGDRSGCDIINISAGGDPGDLSLYEPLRRLRTEFGILTIAGAGRSGLEGSVDTPARFDVTLGVGAHNRNGEFYQGSDWNTAAPLKPDVCALGVGVRSASTRSHDADTLSTGTSYATAVVTGSLARLLQLGRLSPGDPDEWLRELPSYCAGLKPAGESRARLGRIDLDMIP
jgi:hypothetical protein